MHQRGGGRFKQQVWLLAESRVLGLAVGDGEDEGAEDGGGVCDGVGLEAPDDAAGLAEGAVLVDLEFEAMRRLGQHARREHAREPQPEGESDDGGTKGRRTGS